MKKAMELTRYFIKGIIRETTMDIVMLLFPIILLLAAVYSSPEGVIPLVLDGELVTPAPNAIDVTVIIYSVTAIAFLSSLMSFFISFELKTVTPRLKVMKYSSIDIGTALIVLIVLFNLGFTALITSFTLYWVEPTDIFGYTLSIYLISIIFSILGLIFSHLINTKSLGILILLTVVTLDTGFLENPVLSRRYNDPFMDYMPSHKGLESLFRSAFNIGKNWTTNMPFILAYIFSIIAIYIIIMKLKK